MALTAFEKTMIRRIDAEIRARGHAGKKAAWDDAYLTTILEGTEAERQMLISDYVSAVGIPACNAAISAADTEKADAQSLLTEMQAYVT